MNNNIRELNDWLAKAPVMGEFHPLVPLCLPDDVVVVSSAWDIAEKLDDKATHLERPVLITEVDNRYQSRFIEYSVPDCPSTHLISQYLPTHIQTAQNHLITPAEIGHTIVKNALAKDYQIVALLLIDGLSYFDTRNWSEKNEPCFVNAPSITYYESQGKFSGDVGFATVIGSPTIARRLSELGISRPRGFSYWDRIHNELSDFLFRGVPLEQVRSVKDAFSVIDKLNPLSLYIQIIREGLDELAHHRREVSRNEIEATVAAIHQDYRHLVRLVAQTGLRGGIYLTADHGILWKSEHSFERLYEGQGRYSRYMVDVPTVKDHVTKVSIDRKSFFLCHYPYLAAQIRSNDSGIHGGLSSWESIVPFVQTEVNL